MDRKNTIVSLMIGLALTFTLCACSVSGDSRPDGEPSKAQPPEASSSTSESGNTEQPPDIPEDDLPETIPISLTVGGQTFSATLEDSETTRAFAELLPLTLEMSELNGNEKFYYMDAALPTDPENPGQINAGDLMLYGDNCLVLFFDSFSTSYSYTRLGGVTDADGLVDALDSGTVTVTFALAE